MDLPDWLRQTLALSLSLGYWHQLGLAFLLGSFAVATWSDVKHLSAQREFREIWLAFVAALLAFDVYEIWIGDWTAWQVPAIKWGLILVLSLLSLQKLRTRHHLFRLAPADVAALAAAASLLTPLLIIIFYAGAKLIDIIIGPLFRRGNSYPFMPVVSLATILVFTIAMAWQHPAN
jgi:hypothetical protein